MTTKEISDYFDRVATKYHQDRLSNNKLFSDFIEKPSVLDCINNIKSQGRLLDIGCGSGIYSKIFSESGYSVVAIDVSPKMIRIAKEYCYGLDIAFVNSSFEDVSFAGIKFDVVFGSFITGYFNDLAFLFAKVRSLVCKNGIVIISMLHPVRTAAISKEGGVYAITNYFDRGQYMASISVGEEKLPLYKHLLSDVVNAALCAGLKLEKLLEPTPVNPPSHIDASQFYKCPSIAVMCFRGE